MGQEKNYAAVDLSSFASGKRTVKQAPPPSQFSPESDPAMRLDDAASNGEPHSGPFGFCGKEWLEKLLDYSPGKTRTSVAHADKNFSVFVTARMNDKASRIGSA